MNTLINNYWAACIARGEKPRTVHAVRHLEGSLQPKGYVQGWSVNLKQARAMAARMGSGNRVEVIPVFYPAAAKPTPISKSRMLRDAYEAYDKGGDNGA